MNNEKRDINRKGSKTNNDENEGYNENRRYEDAQNDYLNRLPDPEENTDKNKNSSTADDNKSSEEKTDEN